MRKIAVVGGHHRTKMMAPFGDPSWTIWSFSARNMAKLPRVDTWIEIHEIAEFSAHHPEYAAWLNGQPHILMQALSPAYPGAEVYPLTAVIEAFGTQFLKNTACLALALAILRAPDEIGVYGIEQKSETAWARSRLAVQHFIDLAKRRSIKVTIPPACGLMRKEPVYGYEREGSEA